MENKTASLGSGKSPGKVQGVVTAMHTKWNSEPVPTHFLGRWNAEFEFVIKLFSCIPSLIKKQNANNVQSC